MKKRILWLIKFYQKRLQPYSKYFFWFEANCRFIPTCSEYSYEAIERYGILRGMSLSFWRVVRCNPLNKGGHDPVN